MTEEKKRETLEKVLSSESVPFTEEDIETLVEHVDKHMYFLGEKVPFPFEWHDALFSWWENIFQRIRVYSNNRLLTWLTEESSNRLFFIISSEWYFSSVNREEEIYAYEAARKAAEAYSKKNKTITAILSALIT